MHTTTQMLSSQASRIVVIDLTSDTDDAPSDTLPPRKRVRRESRELQIGVSTLTVSRTQPQFTKQGWISNAIVSDIPLPGPVPVASKTKAELETALADVPPSSSPPPPPAALPTKTAPRSRHLSAKPSTENYRSKVQASTFKSPRKAHPTGDRTPSSSGAKTNAWRTLDKQRPYQTARARAAIIRGLKSNLWHLGPDELKEPVTYHVDFTGEEVEAVRQAALATTRLKRPVKSPTKELTRLIRKNASVLANTLPRELQFKGALANRDALDIYNFLDDANQDTLSKTPHTLTIARDELDNHAEAIRASRIPQFLFAREIHGRSTFGNMRVAASVKNEIRNSIEDDLELRDEWTNCAGDIATITWVSEEDFICGATAHSDAHNQQYNKPGNLLLCSTSKGTLRAYPHHRVVRPVITKGGNATDAMRQSQDPWLYASVVSSVYDKARDLAYTASFDRTVKSWRMNPSSGMMELLGTWEHDGNVQLVTASIHEAGLVATAADVRTEAIRIYTVNQNDISRSSFHRLSGRTEAVEVGPNDNWAYFPATLQWGLCQEVSHHLLAGYSPRSWQTDDNDIPDDRKNSGSMSLWDGLTGQAISTGIPIAQNIFEVCWHPSRPMFLVATTPSINGAEHGVRTQIRIYCRSEKGAADSTTFLSEVDNHAGQTGQDFYGAIHILDCYASDINELTIKPNSPNHSYVTAATTDGRVYVWDTAQGDRPIHVLTHGDPIEEFSGDREREDTGVKFTAWGTSPDRFYTGGSDGVVKVWNVRRPKPLIRDLLEVAGPVSAGAFSPDFSKLAIGDASGRVFLLTNNKDDKLEAQFLNVPGGSRQVRRPKPFIPHPEPPPPEHPLSTPSDPDSGIERARKFVSEGSLIVHPNAVVGALQGPNYAEKLGLYRPDAHLDEDPINPLLAAFERNQQQNLQMCKGPRRTRRTLLDPLLKSGPIDQDAMNRKLDFDMDNMDKTFVEEMEREMAVNLDYGLDFESDGPDL